MDQSSWPTFAPHDIENTPSRKDGITAADEKKMREKTVFLIETLCKCKQLAWANKSSPLLPQYSACMYFHRFYQYQSFKKHDRQVVAVACLFLACKVEEDPKRIKNMINGYFEIKKILNPNISQVTDEQKEEMMERVLIAERVILQTLAFDLRIVHPIEKMYAKYKFIVKYLPADGAIVKQSACRFLTDCYRTTIPIQYTQKDIAVSCLFLSTLELGEPPLATKAEPDMTWLDLFDSDISDEKLNEVCNLICDIYETEANVIDPKKALILRTRLAASKKLGPSPNCISSANSPPALAQSSPDRSYLYEEEEEERRKVTVSVIKRSDNGSVTSTECPHIQSQPPPPQSSPYQNFPSPGGCTPQLAPPPPPPSESPWSERSTSGTPTHPPPPPPTPTSDAPERGQPPPPPPPLPHSESPSHGNAENRDQKRMRTI